MMRQTYSGPRKLLLAFDVGTTYSGISYCILDQGKQSEIQGVHEFPGQELAGGNAKIPTVLYYSRDGQVRAAGAEAERDGIDIIAEEEDWVKTEWFKLHLRPKTANFSTGNARIPPLPLNKTVVDVLSDFLKYLNDCARQYIQESHPGIGTSLWTGSSEIHYILSHPNGWEGPQQALMKQAAEEAGLIKHGGRNQLSFITEGEASLNTCVEKGLGSDSFQQGEGVIIVDAGGGTIDISAYASADKGKTFDEIAESQCHPKGSVFVTMFAGYYLDELLQDSPFHSDIPVMKRYFDKTTKCIFSNPNEPHFIRFGRAGDKDVKRRIIGGNLRLDGKDVASFFEPTVQCIVNGVLTQRRIALEPISCVFVVGGFAASHFLFRRLKELLERHGLQVYRPDTQINKVVADGAIAGILDRPVRSRVTTSAFGSECLTEFDPTNPEHVKRQEKRFECWDGDTVLPDGFGIILPRNTRVSETQEFRCTYKREASNPKDLVFEGNILCYRGYLTGEKALWPDNDPANFDQVCTIQANLEGAPILDLCSSKGKKYREVEFDVILLFGLTELKAQIAWEHNGMEKRSPAELIYDTNI